MIHTSRAPELVAARGEMAARLRRIAGKDDYLRRVAQRVQRSYALALDPIAAAPVRVDRWREAIGAVALFVALCGVRDDCEDVLVLRTIVTENLDLLCHSELVERCHPEPVEGRPSAGEASTKLGRGSTSSP